MFQNKKISFNLLKWLIFWSGESIILSPSLSLCSSRYNVFFTNLSCIQYFECVVVHLYFSLHTNNIFLFFLLKSGSTGAQLQTPFFRLVESKLVGSEHARSSKKNTQAPHGIIVEGQPKF
jgi:hypothetical protein